MAVTIGQLLGGQLQAPQVSGYKGASAYNGYFEKMLRDLYIPIAEQDALFQGQMQPIQQDYIRQLLGIADPANTYGRVEDFQNRARSQGMAQGNRNARNIGGGYGTVLGNSLKLDSANRGAMPGNNFMRDQLSGQGRADAYTRALQGLQGYQATGYNNLMNLSGRGQQKSSGGGFLGQALGIASQVAPFFAGGLGGGGGGTASKFAQSTNDPMDPINGWRFI